MKILCFGSLNIDYVYTVDHFVTPGETISSLGLKTFPGGKGLNQAVALAKAGADCYLAGKIGGDGVALIDALNEYGVNTKYLRIDESIPTGHAIIQVNKAGENCIIIHGGANRQITERDIDCVLADFEAGDILLLQNEISNVDYLIRSAHEKGMKVALNPSPIDENLKSMDELRYISWFILNEIEGYELSREKEPEKICKALRSMYPGSTIVLTLGKDGVLYFDGERFASHGIYDVPVVDTTAAGDTFVGYFLSCTVEGLGVEERLEIASKASSITVSRAGASSSVPYRRELDTFGF